MHITFPDPQSKFENLLSLCSEVYICVSCVLLYTLLANKPTQEHSFSLLGIIDIGSDIESLMLTQFW